MVLFCHITSLIEGEPYPALLIEKSGSSLPHVAVLDETGKIQAVHQGEHTIESYTKTLAKANRVKAKLAAMRSKAAAGDQQAQVDVLEASVSLHHLDPKEAVARLGSLKHVSGERAARIQLLITKTMVIELSTRLSRNETNLTDAIAEFANYEKKGIGSDPRLAGIFWQFVLLKGMTDKDYDSSSIAIEKIKEGAKAMGLDGGDYFKELDRKLSSMRGSH